MEENVEMSVFNFFSDSKSDRSRGNNFNIEVYVG